MSDEVITIRIKTTCPAIGHIATLDVEGAVIEGTDDKVEPKVSTSLFDFCVGCDTEGTDQGGELKIETVAAWREENRGGFLGGTPNWTTTFTTPNSAPANTQFNS